MSGEFGPFPTPVRFERRGEFPEHSDRIPPILTAEQAKRLARERLEKWKRDNCE